MDPLRSTNDQIKATLIQLKDNLHITAEIYGRDPGESELSKYNLRLTFRFAFKL